MKKEDNFNWRVGQWLRQLRSNRKMSQLELAKLTEMHRNTISRYEQGKGMPLFAFQRICEKLDVGPTEVLKW
jgi:transcriptional regulator with XRE-family HTH domain